jgi:L-ascorbate metabolism protein UlaG (beta-lactamase superfamily)
MEDSVTLINHATALIQLGGMSILTDPIYSRTVSYLFPRLQKPGIAFEELPSIDLVLISHSDYDHLNMKTLRRLRRRRASKIILPKGLGLYARNAGFTECFELNWWDELEHEGLKITCVPAKHRSKRNPGDANASACCGYVVQAKNHTVYFAGDTAYAEFFTELAARFSIDVALLPIGAYKPEKWFKNLHLHPATALKAFLDLRSRHLVPIHWGTFWISDEPMTEPPKMLLAEAERAGLRDRVHILKNGDSFRFDAT